jgi:hypothetical protein
MCGLASHIARRTLSTWHYRWGGDERSAKRRIAFDRMFGKSILAGFAFPSLTAFPFPVPVSLPWHAEKRSPVTRMRMCIIVLYDRRYECGARFSMFRVPRF